MSGTLATVALDADLAAPRVYPVDPGTVVRLITPAASTAKIEISRDGGFTFNPWAFGTQAASKTYEQVMTHKCLIRATSVTGTATLELDAPADDGAFQRVIIGKGTPAGLVAAPTGTMYLRTDGAAATTLYLKTTGTDANGWTAVTSA